MASAYIVREQRGGTVRYRVRYRLGGRDTQKLSAGSFRRKKDAQARRDWLLGELAAMRVPDVDALRARERKEVLTLRAAAAAWRRSRVDVSDGTDATYAVNLGRIPPELMDMDVAAIAPANVTEIVAKLVEKELARESIRKTLSTLAMVIDFAKVVPNPVRDRDVRLPPDESEEFDVPIASHVLDVCGVLPRAYRLPLLVLDATGMRVGELERLLWRDVDETDCRWRASRAATKTRKARWVPVPQVLFEAVVRLVPREDRDRRSQVFAGFDADAFRTAIARACKALGVPDFSPHDLRHRRATLLHLGGVPAAQAAAWLGHSTKVHLDTYAHASLEDRSEIDYMEAVAGSEETTPRRVVGRPWAAAGEKRL